MLMGLHFMVPRVQEWLVECACAGGVAGSDNALHRNTLSQLLRIGTNGSLGEISAEVPAVPGLHVSAGHTHEQAPGVEAPASRIQVQTTQQRGIVHRIREFNR